MPLLDRQYTPLKEALKPALSIPCYNTQVNAMKQLIYYQETSECVGGTLLCGAGSLMRCLKPCVTFVGSHTEKQWPP